MNHQSIFKQLHHQHAPFVLANAWNARSAQLIESTGYKAIGTSSGAIAGSLGYADGEKIPFSELLYIIKRIKASTTIPLSVDLERGYTDEPGQLIQYIQQLLEIGVAGINLEDAQGEDIYLKKLTAIRNYLTKTNQDLFINARTDVFLQKLDSPLETVVKRAARYAAEGADGLFITAIRDVATIRHITTAVGLPVNVVATPALPSFTTLAECGVKRISMAVFPYNATYNHLDKSLQRIESQQSMDILF